MWKKLPHNWDKILGFFISIIIGGVVGFFGAVLVTTREISDLKSRITAVETDIGSLVKPKLRLVDEMAPKLDQITNKLELLQKENDISRQTRDLIGLFREEEKRRTVNELKELLRK